MPWIALYVVALAGVLAAWVSVNSRRFARRVADEAARLWRAGGEPRPIEPSELERLPPPVRRYLRKALGGRRYALRSARLEHGGTFRAQLDGAWLPIRGKQYFSADSPGFVWWGRLRVLPGLWIDARDRSVGGSGSMLVCAESSLGLGESSGPELDQSALLRLLGELTWLPTVLLDARYVVWDPIDDYHARATLRVGGHEVSGVFEFGSDDLPRTFTAERYRSVGKGRSVLTPFTGEWRGYHEHDGLLVPTQAIGYWHVQGQRLPFARFHVERLEYDVARPF